MATPTVQPTISAKLTPAPAIFPSSSPTESSSPTPQIINLALVPGVVASQSTTYGSQGASRAIDGIKSDGTTNVPSTRTECNYPKPWWRAKIGLSDVKMVKVYNRNDCSCLGRLKDFTVSVLDNSLNVIASVSYSGTAPCYEPVEINFSGIVLEGKYV